MSKPDENRGDDVHGVTSRAEESVMDKGVFRYDTDKTRLGAPPATPLDVEACVRLLDDLIVTLAPHDAQSIADAAQLTALKLALPGMGKDIATVAALTAENAQLREALTLGLGEQESVIAGLRAENERLVAALTEAIAHVEGKGPPSICIQIQGSPRALQIPIAALARWRAALPSSRETTDGRTDPS